MTPFNIFLPTKVLFGAGQINNLHDQKMPGKKSMILISNGKSARTNGYLDRTEDQLRLAKLETAVFDKIQANPLKSTVMEGAAFARKEACDFIVALAHVCDDRFIRMAQTMGMEDAKEPIDFITALSKLQKDCGVADLKMSDYRIRQPEFETMTKNAMKTMGGLFGADRTPLSVEDCVAIYEKSYK